MTPAHRRNGPCPSQQRTQDGGYAAQHTHIHTRKHTHTPILQYALVSAFTLSLYSPKYIDYMNSPNPTDVQQTKHFKGFKLFSLKQMEMCYQNTPSTTSLFSECLYSFCKCTSYSNVSKTSTHRGDSIDINCFCPKMLLL